MKYKIEDYINSGFYEETDSDIVNHKIKIVKCKKSINVLIVKQKLKLGIMLILKKVFCMTSLYHVIPVFLVSIYG